MTKDIKFSEMNMYVIKIERDKNIFIKEITIFFMDF